jgi:hypothetical protein
LVLNFKEGFERWGNTGVHFWLKVFWQTMVRQKNFKEKL